MTGIGQVTREFLKHILHDKEFGQHEWFLYTDGELTREQKASIPNAQWQWRSVQTWWKRQDIPHQYFFEAFSLPRAIQDDKVDVFLSLYQSATILNQKPTTNDLRHKNIRHVMLVHDMIPKLFPEYLSKWTSRLHYRQIERGITQATHIVTPSLATKADIVQLLNISGNRITEIALGVDERFFQRFTPDHLERALQEYGLTPGYLYHGGGLEIRKNTEAVLRVYAELVREEIPDLPPLVISGKIHREDNPLATPVTKLMHELDLEEKVKLLGLVPEDHLPLLYQGASMFLFPSRYEGFGLPVLEAWASGTPVITTRAGSLGELVSPGEALLIEDRGAMEYELKAHIKQLIAQPELGHTLAGRGLEHAKQYRWETFSQKVRQCLLQ